MDTKVRRSGSRFGKRFRWTSLLSSLVLVLSMSVALGLPASATNIANFEIDGDLVANNDTPPGDDWASVIHATRNADGTCSQSSGDDALIICDEVKTDPDTYPGGAKEEDPASWVPIQASNVTPKTDITNVYALGRFDPVDGPVILNGMERLPKAGDLHLDFEFNQYINAEGIPTDSNGTVGREVGDVLIAYDMGGSRNTNTGAISVKVFIAKAGLGLNGTAGYDYNNPDTQASGNNTASGSGITAVMNTTDIAAGSWGSYDDHYNLVNTIPAFSFAEAAIELSDPALNLSNVCVNYITVKSRASESVTAQLKDTTGPQGFPLCGGLDVKKYIDVNANGSYDVGTDVLADDSNNTATWHFEVTGPDGATAVVCEGDLGASTGDAVLHCGNLAPGDYVITETQTSGFVNTDPGPLPANTGSTVTKTATVTVGGNPTVSFGNTCYINKTFEVTNVPSGVTGLFAWYVITGGLGAPSAQVDVPLTLSGTTASATVSDTFIATSVINWGFGINHGEANEEQVTVATGEMFTDGAYPDCAKTDTEAFPTGTVTGSKFKDIDSSGTKDAGEPGLSGWQFYVDTNGDNSLTAGELNATTDASGDYTISNVPVGTHTVREVGQSGWLQTAPVGGEASVTVNLTDAYGGTAVSVDPFGNTPLYDISVSVNHQTSSTQTTSISCVDAGSNTVGSGSGDSYSATNLQINQSSIVCTITVTDP